jgi:DNA-directed RNA polymerase subunit RPC12/RpoP
MEDQFKEWEAAELFCAKCKKARPVRKRLLLVLSDSDKYDYICAVCGEPVGGKIDKKPDNIRFTV